MPDEITIDRTYRRAEEWLLTPVERGNPFTDLDRRRDDGRACTFGNEITPLVHGAAYFPALFAAIAATGPGDLVMFTDWRGDPDEHLDGRSAEVSQVLADACGRGVDVRGLIWRSHLDKLQFSEVENRHLGEAIDAAGGECLLDMRVRFGGSHHQKLVVIRHPGRPEIDVAFVGGIDLCHSRHDDIDHRGDRQAQRIAPEYGPIPPWHDIQLAVRGLPSVISTRRSGSGGTIPRRCLAIHCIGSVTPSNGTIRVPGRCRYGCRIRHRVAGRPYRCCVPTRTGGMDTRSHRPVNAAPPADTAKPCPWPAT